MLDQYRRLKAEHPGTILFFRMGDFYETFGDDALVASRVLGITLTSRDKKKEGSLPLAGVPHHAVDGYLRTLVNEGYSVAIADQMEPAAEARGLVDRQIVEVLTPGTITRNGILNAVESNYIVALLPEEGRAGVLSVGVPRENDRHGVAVRGRTIAAEIPFDRAGSAGLSRGQRQGGFSRRNAGDRGSPGGDF